MTDRQKSWAAYGLASLIILCATILGALRVLDASVVVALIGMALSGVGWYHAAGPGQAAIQPSLWFLLPFLSLGTPGCYNDGAPFFAINGLWSSRHIAPAATSITPITVTTGGASGFTYSGEAYDVACTVSGTVTLYPAVYSTALGWEVYQDFAYVIAASVATQATVTMPARTGTGLTWNAYMTGTGSVSGCTASGRSGPAPSRRSSSSSGGSGTVTSVDCGTGLTCTPDPIVGAGTIVPTFGTATGNVAQGGVVTGAACAYPTTFTFNNAGQVTACTAGSAPGGIFARTTGGAVGTLPQLTDNFLMAPGIASNAIEYFLTLATRSTTAQSLYCRVGTAPGGTATVIFTVRENAVDQTLTCTITGAATTCNNTLQTFTSVAGDRLSIKFVASNASLAADATCSFEEV